MWIDFDGTLDVVDINQTMANISAALSDLVGQEVQVVEVKTDTNGKLTQVVVLVPGDEDTAEAVVAKVSDAPKSTTDAVLSRVVGAGLVGAGDKSSGHHTRSGAVAIVVWCLVWQWLAVFV